MRAVDLFAGPGGWDVGARELDIDPLGIELDEAACRVREAAGLGTLKGDVSALDPEEFPCELLIASPPCTAFSMAGKGEGRAAMDALLTALEAMAAGWQVDHEALDEVCADSTAHLVLEPLRWALALKPGLICCEQVPPALPIWEAMEPVLRGLGYWTWSGVCSAEQYGVAQTRKRAFLIASLHGPVSRPTPTHQRYVAPRRRDDEGGGLFDLPESERVVLPEDRDLLPWVSMAEALGWTDGPVPSPAPTVTSGGGDTGGVEVFGSKGARARARGAVLVNPYNRPNSAERSVDEPAPTVTSARSAEWAYGVSVAGKRPRTRPITEPAPSITGAGAGGLDEWVPAGLDRRQTGGDGAAVPLVPVDRPSPTMTAEGLAKGRDVWVGQRRDSGPAATRDPRSLDDPSFTIRSAGSGSAPSGVELVAAHTPGAQSENAVRVTIEQAATLQGFPPGYPWEAAGSRSAAFRCIGNAVPPPLARAVLAEALSSVNEAAA